MNDRFEVRDMRNGAWFWSSNLMLNAKIPSAIKLTYFGLCSFSNKDGKCYPSFDKLAKMSGMSRSSAIRSVKTLTEAKILRVKKETGKSNRYDLLKVTSVNLELVSRATQKWCQKQPKTSVNLTPKQDHINKTN